MKALDVISSIADALAGWKGYTLAAAIGAALGASAAIYVQGAIYEARVATYEARIATIEKTHADEAADQARIALAEIVRLQNLIAGIDADGYQELLNAKAKSDKLNADLRAGTVRLHALASSCVPIAAGTAGMGDGAAIAELDGATSQSLTAITDDGDLGIIKLTACQAYAKAVSTPPVQSKSGEE